jgi:hypothetical protein
MLKQLKVFLAYKQPNKRLHATAYRSVYQPYIASQNTFG